MSLLQQGQRLQAKILAPAATKTEFCMIANDVPEYGYEKNFDHYHTSIQMADFLIQLHDGNHVVGIVDRETFEFELSDKDLH